MTGLVDRMFQVLPEQENEMYVGDMLGDGLLVVELDSPSSATPEANSPQTNDTLYVFEWNITNFLDIPLDWRFEQFSP